MKTFDIEPVSTELREQIQQKIDNKTKPVGALGRLEEIALQIGMIQNTLEPQLHHPTIAVFAGDHGIAAEGVVNPYPQEVTSQMVYNFLDGGAAINILGKQHGIDIRIIDAGVNYNFEDHPRLINGKIVRGTKNYRFEPAMSRNECDQAIKKGTEIVRDIQQDGCNIIGFGEMGIGNTSSASLITSALTGIPIDECTGSGTGLDEDGLDRKKAVLSGVMRKYQSISDPFQVLTTFGGFEIAMICGGILQAAELDMVILIDGFIVTAALLAAYKLNPLVLDYCLSAHVSGEKAHSHLLSFLGLNPILDLGMRLGEGSGAAVAFPIVQSAINFLNQMASFESAGVSQKKDKTAISG